jgi:hypothetical protein
MKMIYIAIGFVLISGLLLLSTRCRQSTKPNMQLANMKNYFDSTGGVFIKLYKTSNDKGVIYWETWNTNEKSAIEHWGTIGERGTSKKINALSIIDLRNKINSLIDQKIGDGYAEIPIEKQFTVTINFKLKTWGTKEDLDRREFIRNIVTENLGWTGNGRCDDGDIGSGEMTLFADVVDPYIAIKSLTKEFVDKNIKDDHTFGIMQGDSVITSDFKQTDK